MVPTSAQSEGTGRHAPFAAIYVHAGLAAALTAGFGTAVYLAAHLGLGLSAMLPAVAQVHGHAQVFGWLGLFVMGVSLHFLPRLSGVPLAAARLATAPCWLVVAGIALRSAAQPALAVGAGRAWARPGLFLAGAAQLAGVGIYAGLILASLRRSRIDPRTHPSVGPLRPLLLICLVGWVTAGSLMGVGALSAARQGSALVSPELHRLAADAFGAAVLLPVAFAFSLRVFPLYLQIEAPRRSPAPFALAYGLATAAELVPRAAVELWGVAGGGWEVTAQAGAAGRAMLILAFIAGLGLHRRRLPRGAVQPERDGPARFGHFAPQVWTAYAFLALAAGLQLVRSGADLGGAPLPLHEAGLRHAYLAGFGTLLLLGVAPRMVPGFLGARGPAFPRLVLPPLFLAAPAALVATAFLLLPAAAVPGWLHPAFATAGVLGWLAVALLAANLWAPRGGSSRCDQGVPRRPFLGRTRPIPAARQNA